MSSSGFNRSLQKVAEPTLKSGGQGRGYSIGGEFYCPPTVEERVRLYLVDCDKTLSLTLEQMRFKHIAALCSCPPTVEERVRLYPVDCDATLSLTLEQMRFKHIAALCSGALGDTQRAPRAGHAASSYCLSIADLLPIYCLSYCLSIAYPMFLHILLVSH